MTQLESLLYSLGTSVSFNHILVMNKNNMIVTDLGEFSLSYLVTCDVYTLTRHGVGALAAVLEHERNSNKEVTGKLEKNTEFCAHL